MSDTRIAAGNTAQRLGSGAGRLMRAWRILPHERRLAAFAALGLFLTLFLPWYQETVLVENSAKRVVDASVSVTGWGAFSFVEAAVLLVAASVLVLLFQRAEGKAFHLPGGDGWVITAAGFWTGVLIVWRIFDKQSTSIQGPGADISGIEWGIFVALAVAAFLTYAGSRVRAAHQPEPPLPGEESRRREEPRRREESRGAEKPRRGEEPRPPRDPDVPSPPRRQARTPPPVAADPSPTAAKSQPRPTQRRRTEPNPAAPPPQPGLAERTAGERTERTPRARTERAAGADPPDQAGDWVAPSTDWIDGAASRRKRVAADEARPERVARGEARTEPIAWDEAPTERVAADQARTRRIAPDEAPTERNGTEGAATGRLAPSTPAARRALRSDDDQLTIPLERED